ncbi:unnamed protein product [Microthlaspi erraticum]|uniref:Reverse transcriptase domain-containing protein n=1 Tax=Microthlaspi erraticum TaxID=1685480 RepID=A0A6D2JJY7_9BRAS|nr:unnamed protein product [Microthlaspi erraticum]
MKCVCSVTYSFLLNGAPQVSVIPTRGLRQGDPLSPYLFILCTEVLSGLCNRAQARGDLPGIKVARQSPAINHLLFADDTMFFCKANAACCETLSKILSRYEAASGQCISVQKSAITFSAKTSLEVKQEVKRLMKIPNEGGVGKYLGLPEHFGRKKRDIFSSIVDRIRLKANCWSSGFLSSAGKQVLLQAVLSATPTYIMSCFKLPLSLCKRIQSALTRFWWDEKPDKRKICWVSWDKLTIPKNAGGLGFREIERFNDAMLAKIGWRILQAPESLLARILLGKYCHSSSFMECQSPATASHGWRSILAGRDILKQGLGWKVGNGEKIKVWLDPWLSSSSPSIPVGPAPVNADSIYVKDLMLPNGGWNLKAIREQIPHLEGSIRRIIIGKTTSPDSLV